MIVQAYFFLAVLCMFTWDDPAMVRGQRISSHGWNQGDGSHLRKEQSSLKRFRGKFPINVKYVETDGRNAVLSGVEPISGSIQNFLANSIFPDQIKGTCHRYSLLSMEDEEAIIMQKTVYKLLRMIEISIRMSSSLIRVSGDTTAGIVSGLMKGFGGLIDLLASLFSKISQDLSSTPSSNFSAPLSDLNRYLIMLKVDQLNGKFSAALNSSSKLLNALSQTCIWGGEITESLTSGLGEALQDSFRGLELIPASSNKLVKYLLDVNSTINSSIAVHSPHKAIHSYSSSLKKKLSVEQLPSVEIFELMNRNETNSFEVPITPRFGAKMRTQKIQMKERSDSLIAEKMKLQNQSYSIMDEYSSLINENRNYPFTPFNSSIHDLIYVISNDVKSSLDFALTYVFMDNLGSITWSRSLGIKGEREYSFEWQLFIILCILCSIFSAVVATDVPFKNIILLAVFLISYWTILHTEILFRDRIIQRTKVRAVNDFMCNVEDTWRNNELNMTTPHQFNGLSLLNSASSNEREPPMRNFSENEKDPTVLLTSSQIQKHTARVAVEALSWLNTMSSALWNVYDGYLNGGGLGLYMNEVYEEMLSTELAAIPPKVANLRLKRFDLGSNPPVFKMLRSNLNRNNSCVEQLLKQYDSSWGIKVDSHLRQQNRLRKDNSSASRNHTSNGADNREFNFLRQEHVGRKGVRSLVNKLIYQLSGVLQSMLTEATNEPPGSGAYDDLRSFYVDCDKIVLIADLLFISKDMDIILTLRSSELKSVLPEIQLKISEVVFEGVVKFEIQLTPDFPFFGNATVWNPLITIAKF